MKKTTAILGFILSLSVQKIAFSQDSPPAGVITPEEMEVIQEVICYEKISDEKVESLIEIEGKAYSLSPDSIAKVKQIAVKMNDMPEFYIEGICSL